MADTKISALSAVTNPATTDVLPIVNAGATKKIAVTDLSVCVQEVSTNFLAVATGTTTVPFDDTIPQNTEGDQYMTQAITPKSTTNILVIEAQAFVGNSASVHEVMALFQDATANALAATAQTLAGTGQVQSLVLRYVMAAGTTSATTFKIRIGGSSAGTTTFGGSGGGRIFGGISVSNIIIREYKA